MTDRDPADELIAAIHRRARRPTLLEKLLIGVTAIVGTIALLAMYIGWAIRLVTGN